MRTIRRAGFTLNELLTVLAVLAFLAALVPPALMRARAAYQRKETHNNLKQIGLALHNYHDANRVLPPGSDNNHFSAASRLLPYLEHEELYKKIDFNKPIDDRTNEEARQTEVKRFLNPDDKQKAPPSGIGGDPTKSCGATNYLLNGLTFFRNSRSRIPASFPDGTSNTIIVAETLKGDGGDKGTDVRRQYVILSEKEAARYKGKEREKMGVAEFKANKGIAGNRCASWMDGRFLQGTFLPGRMPNDPRPDVLIGAPEGMKGLSAPRSLTDTINLALCDGSVKVINAKRISAPTWERAQNPADGQPLGNDW